HSGLLLRTRNLTRDDGPGVSIAGTGSAAAGFLLFTSPLQEKCRHLHRSCGHCGDPSFVQVSVVVRVWGAVRTGLGELAAGSGWVSSARSPSTGRGRSVH